MELKKKVIIAVSAIAATLAAVYTILVIHTNYEIDHMDFSIKDDERE